MATTQNKVGGLKKPTQRAAKKNADELSPEGDILSGKPAADEDVENNIQNKKSDNLDQEVNISLTDEQRREHIAIAAYYNAEKRGFTGDNQVEDWLEAEKQIGNYYSGSTANNRDQPSVQQIIDQTEVSLDDLDARSDHTEIIDPSDIKRWSKELGISATALREAISRVGAKVEAVKAFLSETNTRH